MPELTYLIGLLFILLCILLLPLFVKTIEYNLEIFLFIMGIIVVTIAGLWDIEIIKKALLSGINLKHPIVEVVFIAGVMFTVLSDKINSFTRRMENILGLKTFVFLVVFILGIISSMITVIVAALILVEIISILKFDKDVEEEVVVYSCFSIGIGAALTPIGEPLSTILISRLSGAPYNADFLFLVRHMAVYIIPAVFLSSLMAASSSRKENNLFEYYEEKKQHEFKEVLIRTGKIYLFITGLELLAKGFSPAVEYLIPLVKPEALYFINMLSAVLDNATLTAAEITPAMQLIQIKAMLMSLLISGGMLIPGNTPNIVMANKLKIGSLRWAIIGFPFGMFLLLIYFIVMFLIKY
jgi:predicted cation transporter